MTIKLDENLPATLAPRLRSLGHDTDTVRDEGLLSAMLGALPILSRLVDGFAPESYWYPCKTPLLSSVTSTRISRR